MSKGKSVWNRAVDECRDAVRQVRAQYREDIAFDQEICQIVDELYGKDSDFREDPLGYDEAFWVDLAENRLNRFHREPAFIANYVRIVVKERRAQKDETMNWRVY